MTKVLIVDDEESIRFSFSSILKDEGYEVISADHPIVARSILNANKFDVAVIDRLLITENGMDIVEFINEAQPCCTTILMSAYPNFKSAAEGFKHNLFAYLQKPVKKNELCSIVEKASLKSLEKKRKNNYELELIRLQKMSNMGLLCGGIIHDYNNILMPVMGLAQLACLDLPPENKLSGQLDKLIAASTQIQGFSQLAMSYSHPDNNEFKNTNVKSLFEEALAILRIMIPKSITIGEKNVNGDCYAYVNAKQIKQVVINLGIYVMKSLGENLGHIDILIEKLQFDQVMPIILNDKIQNYIKLTIKNDGVIVDEDTMNKMAPLSFDPSKYSEEMGLSVSCDIIKNHGGLIVGKRQLELGSVFSVFLPLS